MKACSWFVRARVLAWIGAAAVLSACTASVAPPVSTPDSPSPPATVTAPTSPPVAAAAVEKRSESPAPGPRARGDKPFVDVTRQAGIRFKHEKPTFDKKLKKIMPWMASVGASVAAGDYNNDGYIDLYLTNSQQGKPNALYRNNRDGTFTDVTAEAGVAGANDTEHGVSMKAVWGDFDNDDWLDLYVVKWGRNILYHNNRDGTFTDVTDKAFRNEQGAGSPWANGNAAVWLDYNDDGRLDLYVGNYFRPVNLFRLQDSRVMHEDFETARDGGANALYRNNGDGTFTSVGEELGVADTGWTLDVGVADYDNDGDQDLFVANDFGQDKVFRLNADATFTDVTEKAIGFDTRKGMNIDFGDFNNDGWPDFYVSNIWTKEYVQEGNQLYRNNADGTFVDVATEAGVFDGGWAWGAKFWDYDNDGRLDLIVANGFVSGDPKKEYFRELALAVTRPGFDPIDAQNWPEIGDSTFAGYEPKRVFHNRGNEAFEEVAAKLGLADTRDGRGLAVFDFDNDGDLDVYISNQGQEGVLFRNDLAHGNNWLEVDLRGTTGNRHGVGARITLVAGRLSQIREVDGGNGGHSQSPFRQHFGLGKQQQIERLEVRWPNGYVQQVTDVKPNQILRITEQTPAAHLAERKRWKEVQLEAWRKEVEREQRLAQAPGEAAREKPASWEDTIEFKREYLKLKAAVWQTPENPQAYYEFGMLLDRGGRKNAAMESLEKAVQLAPDRLLYSNTYRMIVRRYGHTYFDRSIRFFEDLAAQHPKEVMPRLNRALAYVDKMPYPKLGIVHQGILSNKSLGVLDDVLKDDPHCWAAKFIRGMNHLHWPQKLGHAPLAIVDFTELIAMQKGFPPEKQRDYFALAYLALGDAYVKNRDRGEEENLAKARQSWEAGRAAYPNCDELRERLELLDKSREELIETVRKVRGLEEPVNTDLAQVWVD